jgi:hypothetical protein
MMGTSSTPSGIWMLSWYVHVFDVNVLAFPAFESEHTVLQVVEDCRVWYH